MFWLAMAILVVVAAVLVARRRADAEGRALREEPWRASLQDDSDDEGFDADELRRAEREWQADGAFDGEVDDGEREPWRG